MQKGPFLDLLLKLMCMLQHHCRNTLTMAHFSRNGKLNFSAGDGFDEMSGLGVSISLCMTNASVKEWRIPMSSLCPFC